MQLFSCLIRWINDGTHRLWHWATFHFAGIGVALSLVLAGCASSRDSTMARIFEAPNVIHVCVRPPNVPKDKRMWALDADGSPVFEAREVDLARRAGLGVYIWDEVAPRESARLLPIPYHRLECPAPPKPRVAAAKVDAKEKESKKAETEEAERPKPLPQPIPRETSAVERRVEAHRCTAYAEPGQTRRRSGSGARTCTRILVRRGGTEPVAAESPREVEPPAPVRLSEETAREYEDWGLTPADVSALTEDRARECLQGLCHARHPNFVPKDKNKPAGMHDGQSWSTGSGGGGTKTTVKTRGLFGKPNEPKPVAKPKPNGAAAGQGAPANGAATNERRVPNPNGRKGGQAHQDKVNEVAADIDKRGLVPDKEHRVKTPGGHKDNRYVDVAGLDEGGNAVEYHQIGKQRKDGQPVERERKALDDVERAKGQRPTFHPYNKEK